MHVTVHTPETDHRKKNTESRIVDLKPCEKCGSMMGNGNVLLIEIDLQKSPPGWNSPGVCPNPVRTGGAFIAKESALRERFTEDQLNINDPGWAFIDIAVSKLLFGTGNPEEAAPEDPIS